MITSAVVFLFVSSSFFSRKHVIVPSTACLTHHNLVGGDAPCHPPQLLRALYRASMRIPSPTHFHGAACHVPVVDVVDLVGIVKPCNHFSVLRIPETILSRHAHTFLVEESIH